MKSPNCSTMDRRRSPRLDLTLRCVLRSARSAERGGSGTTFNISRTGALVRCEHWKGEIPSTGEVFDIELALARNGVGHRRCVRGQVSVVRTALDDEGAPILALQFGKVQFGIWREEQLRLVC